MTSIILSQVSKKYPGGEKTAVSNINLEIEQGEFFCIVGPSGCGKSTLLKMISNIEQPTSGQITRPNRISMVFQSGALFPWLNVEENIAFGLKMGQNNAQEILKQVEKYLSLVHLEDFKHKYPRELSGGQRQRVGIARALATSPEVLLLDEPFSSLDLLTTKKLHQDLLSIWQSEQKTIVLVSHSLEEATELGDRVAVMKEGQIKKIVEVNFTRPREVHQFSFRQQVEAIEKILES